MGRSIIISTSFLQDVENNISTSTDINWTPILFIQTAMGCPRLVEEKRNLEVTLSDMLSPENIVRRMLTCQEDRNAGNSMIAVIQGKL